ncbi:hypothetical protein H5T88_09380 [bacterium]|nr:hypothetical protein [bacterium]
MVEKITDDKRLIASLQKVAFVAKQVIEEAIADQTISLELTPYQRKNLILGWSEGLFYKPTLKFKIGFSMGRLIDQIINREESREALNILSAAYSKGEGHLRLFIGMLADQYLKQYEKEQKIEDSIVQDLINRFLKEIKGEPLKYWAKVILLGVRLETEKVTPFQWIVLRKPREEDIWIESPVPALVPEPPSLYAFTEFTIMDIEIETTNGKALTDKIELISKFLRLFRVGGVKTVHTFMTSEALSMVPSQSFPLNYLPPPTPPYTVREEDEERLRNFWGKIEKPLLNLYNPTQAQNNKLEHIFVANTFYEDALLREGRFEERVAKVVMGLEALLMLEEQEASYRLRLRAAKLLGLLGFDAVDVKNRLREAYKIRSGYVHGEFLSKEQEKSISNKYGDQQAFLHTILDYLRLLIITSCLCKMSKNKLVKLLDDAFVDQNKNDELVANLSEAIKIAKEVKE